MPEIYIDGKTYQVEEGKNLLEACQSLGLELPYFCWHPALGSVGSCRQCAVILYQNEEDTRGRITMTCMTPVSEGQRLSLNNPKAEKFRASLIEATMTNHPHDCPVCEEAGECHLQDMTLLSGHNQRRFQGPKRTHNNQYLGPFINHEMNRCIACYRCVRFYRDYSGGTDLNVFASRNNVYFGRTEDGVLESEFSGNLAEVCPTGVFTDKTYSEHYARKWELQSAPSICTHCSVGCNIYPGERKGVLRRITNRFNPNINGHFLCDRGRFGYEFVNHKDRTTQAWQRNTKKQTTDILTQKSAQSAFKKYLTAQSTSDIIAIGSSRSSLENNFTLRALVEEQNFYSDIKESEHMQVTKLVDHYQQVQTSSSLKDLEASDVALMIGEDVTQTAPRIALSLRQMTKNAGKIKAASIGIQYWSAAEVKNITQDLKSPLHIVSSHSTRLDDVATTTSFKSPKNQIELINKVSKILSSTSEISTNTNDDIDKQAERIAHDLKSAKNPFIVTSTNIKEVCLFEATLQLSKTLKQLNNNAGLICALPQSNSLGLSLLTNAQNNLDVALERIEQTPPSTLIIMEADLYRHYDADKLEALFDKIKNIIVLDHLLTPTAEQADLVLPTATFVEYHGSWVNFEGRLQPAIACFPPKEQCQPAHQWLSNGTPFHSLIGDLAGMLNCLELPSLYSSESSDFNFARKTVRSSGRTALNAFIDIKEIPPDTDKDSSYQYSQEGVSSNIAASLSSEKAVPPAYIWSPGWNSNEALNQFQNGPNEAINGAHPGIKLFTQACTKKIVVHPVNTTAADSISIPEGCLQALPYHHIFADEELSGYAPAIIKQVPPSTIRLNTKQAQIINVTEGGLVSVILISKPEDKRILPLPLTIDDSIPDRIALIPAPILQRCKQLSKIYICLEKNNA